MPDSCDSSFSARLLLAVDIAREAGRHTLQYFRRPGLTIDRKKDDSPVTVADREAEQLLRQRIGSHFPQDGIVGEEFPEKAGASGYRWILDPIDGTKSFIHGVPLYGTLVGVEYGGRGVVGVIDVPAMDERIYAAAGTGAWHQIGDVAPQRARVSKLSTLAESLFVTSEVANFRTRGRADVYTALDAACRLTRTWGDCFGYLLVATGRAELMIDPVMNVWDAAAIQPILEEAGGTFTDWHGTSTIHNGEGIATNGLVLADVLTITKAKS